MPIPTPAPHPAESLILARIPAAVRQRAARVQLMVFDVDGVLTDGSLWYADNGEIVKRFHALDGQGIRLLGAGGIAVSLITARDGGFLTRRAADLGITDVQQSVHDKLAALTALAHKRGVSLESVGFMGDDINDLAALRQAGFSVTVPAAPPYVAQATHWVTEKQGGNGAVRECCDLILASQGRLGPLLDAGARVRPVSGSLQ